MHLADPGAEVIKIEDPRSGGRRGRQLPPYAQDGDSLFLEATLHGYDGRRIEERPAPGRSASAERHPQPSGCRCS